MPAYRSASTCGVDEVCAAIAPMYADFFGFRELPFNNTPDPRFFYSTPDHEEALASLVYAVKARKGFVLLSGEIGAGKTLVTRMMLRHFGTQIAFATIHHAVHSPEDLMESICTEFELPVKSRASTTQTVRVLHDYLLAEFAQNIPVVLVLDEAQNLPVEAFEQLRMIGNLEADDAKLLQIAIVGQPELQRVFLSPQLRQLRQRVFRMFHLPALSEEATEGYIRHRLSVAGDDTGRIFDRDAISAVYRFSRGVPRIINTVCDNALLSAYSANRSTVNRASIESVIAQMLTGTAGAGSTEDAFASASQGSTGVGNHAPRQAEAPGPEPTPQHARPAKGARDDVPPASLVSDLRASADSRDLAPISCPGNRAGTAHDVRARVDEAKRRIAAVERRLHGAAGGIAEARAIHASLKPLVDQGRTIVGRAETASQELKRRDAQFRTLATTVKSAVRDLRNLVDRARETASKTVHAESDARAIHDRLAAQSRRSRRVADELTQLVDRMVSPDSRTSSTPQVIKERASTIEAHRDPPVPRPSGQGTPHHVQQELQSTRESLSDLRRLARRPPAQSTATHITGPDLPTTRLARQVEDLLELVATDGGQKAM